MPIDKVGRSGLARVSIDRMVKSLEVV